jgi:hypothetical protein
MLRSPEEPMNTKEMKTEDAIRNVIKCMLKGGVIFLNDLSKSRLGTVIFKAIL